MQHVYVYSVNANAKGADVTNAGGIQNKSVSRSLCHI